MTPRYDIHKILDVVLAFVGESKYEKLLGIILDKMMEITNSDAGTLYILEDNALLFRIIRNNSLNVHKSIDDVIDLPPIPLDPENIQNISAYTALNNEIVVIDDVYEDERFNFEGPKNYDKITGYRTQSMLTLPLSKMAMDGTEEVIGVIQLINAQDEDTLYVTTYDDVWDPPIIPGLAKIAANTLSGSVHLNEITTMFNSFIGVIMQAIDERSAYNKLHTYNVARYCTNFAEYLGKTFPPDHKYHFDEYRIERLRMAAFLHDIGKIVTPLEVMDKKDRLGSLLDIVRSRFELRRWQLRAIHSNGTINVVRYTSSMSELEDAALKVEEMNTASFLDDDALSYIDNLKRMEFIDQDGSVAPFFTDKELEALSVRKGTLTNTERLIMQEHVKTTGRMLDGISGWKNYKSVPQWAKDHHELMDGSGYPLGKTKNDLSTETLILTICDIFDALSSSDRPYKQSIPLIRSHGILLEMATEGKLHEGLVKLFIKSKAWEG